MRIEARVKLAEGIKDAILTGIINYSPEHRKVQTHVCMEIPISLAPFAEGTTRIISHNYHSTVENVDGCRFLDVMGNDNKAGKLLSIEIID